MNYYFIRSNGRLYRLTYKAYITWVKDTAYAVKTKRKVKIRNYGLDLGKVANIVSVNDLDFIKQASYFLEDTN